MPKNEPDFNEILAQIQEQEDAGGDEDYVTEPQKPTDETINDYVIDKGSELLNANIDLINRVKNRIATAHDVDELSVLSNLFKSSNSILSTLTSISIQNKKDKTARELGTNRNTPKLPTTVNNTMFVGTREDMLKMLEKNINTDIESISGKPYDEGDLNADPK